ncbi:MAG: hypothetical protein ACLT98_11690 [Eggerthellaceae bacterium]
MQLQRAEAGVQDLVEQHVTRDGGARTPTTRKCRVIAEKSNETWSDHRDGRYLGEE